MNYKSANTSHLIFVIIITTAGYAKIFSQVKNFPIGTQKKLLYTQCEILYTFFCETTLVPNLRTFNFFDFKLRLCENMSYAETKEKPKSYLAWSPAKYAPLVLVLH